MGESVQGVPEGGAEFVESGDLLPGATESGDTLAVDGIDLARRSVRLHRARAEGSVALRTKLRREKVLDFLASQPRCLVVAEGR